MAINEWPNLSSARTTVKRLMIDDVVITHETGPETLNEETGKMQAQAPVTIYTGKAKVRRHRTQSINGQEEGGGQAYITRVTVGLPLEVDGVNTPTIPVGAYVKVTASVRDSSLVGREYLVIENPGNTFAVQQSLECEEATISHQERP